MGAADDLAAGTSTFLHELNRASFALRTATDRSLVILDELGRGTATHDGVAVAGATLAHLVSVARATTIFVTHYHGLAAAAAAEHPGRVANAHMAYATTRGNGDRLRLDDDVVMLYALEPGLCDDSFGLHAARAAGMPRRVLDVAQAKADDLEARGA